MGYVLGVEIDSNNMKLAYGKTIKNKLFLRKCASIKFDSEISVDGKLVNIDEIGKRLKSFITTNKIRTKKIVFLLQGTQIITRYTSLPFTNIKEIEKNILYTLKNYFPQNISNYIMDYKIMYQDTLENKSYLLMSAAPEDMLDGYMKLCGSLKLKPQYADIHCNCIFRIYQYIIANDTKYFKSPLIILCIDWEFTNTVILANNSLQFNRVIRFGISNFENQKEIDNDSMSIIISELRKYIDYFATSRTKEDSAIKSIYLIGLFSNNQKVADEIEKNLSIPVNIFSNNSWVYEKKESSDIRNLLSVLGLIFTYRR